MKPKKTQSMFHTKNTMDTKNTKSYFRYASGGRVIISLLYMPPAAG